MLWKFFKSDTLLTKALEVRTVTYDLSPTQLSLEAMEKLSTSANQNSRLWIEDWNETDEARLRDPDVTFGISWSNRMRT